MNIYETAIVHFYYSFAITDSSVFKSICLPNAEMRQVFKLLKDRDAAFDGRGGGVLRDDKRGLFFPCRRFESLEMGGRGRSRERHDGVKLPDADPQAGA